MNGLGSKSCKNKIGNLGGVKKRALEFLRYLDNMEDTASESKYLIASRPEIETLLPRPLEVTATSKLGHFIPPYRTFIVPSLMKIGDGGFWGVVQSDMD